MPHTEEFYDAYSFIQIDDVPDEVNNALRLIADNLIRQSTAPVIPGYSKPPPRVYDGLIVFADGINWDPGFGRGVYIWDSAVDISGIFTDGAIVGTIPAWEPVGDYNIQCNFLSFGSSPAQAQAIISSNAAGNNRAVLGQLTSNEIFARHASGQGSSDGSASTPLPLADDQLSTLTMRLQAASDVVSVVVNGVTTSVVFNQYKGPPSFTTIFDDTTFGVAVGIFLSRLLLNDVAGGDNRIYLLDDGLTGIIEDTGGGNQDGAWNAIIQANILTQQGAWIPLHRASVTG